LDPSSNNFFWKALQVSYQQSRMKIAIIQERKNPPDSRVALAPDQAELLKKQYNLDIKIESSPNRCFQNDLYQEKGFSIVDDIKDADILFGIKEVPITELIPNKKYFFFSHTIKKQPYNRPLLLAILEKNITLIDYEALKDSNGNRLVAFGVFAGMVGAHNALWTFAQRKGHFYLPRITQFQTYAEAQAYYKTRQLPTMKVVVTGGGRVASGAVKVLLDMGLKQISPEEYLNKQYDEPVFTQLKISDYVARKDGETYEKRHFYANPEVYKSTFAPYYKVSDIFINGIYYDQRAPAFFSIDDMKKKDFNIQVIGDVTCDIAPNASIPATIDASTIADPVFGFDPYSMQKVAPYQDKYVDMMTIDNLPNELPQDASRHFGDALIKFIIPELLGKTDTDIIERATVTRNGQLTKHFAYLQDYVDGK